MAFVRLLGNALSQGFSSSTLVTLEAASSLVVWGFPVSCGMLNIIRGLSPPDASSTLTVVTIKSVSRHWEIPMGGKISPD